MEKYLYHLTTKEALPSIFSNGLKPLIGKNSITSNEKELYIYLCKKSDIPYWILSIRNTIAVKIKISDINKDKLKKYKYDLYDEYIYSESIDSEKIKRAYIIPKPNINHMKKLCKSYVLGLNYLILKTIRFYNNQLNDSFTVNNLIGMYRSSLFVLKNLDFSSISKEDVINQLKSFGESGEYTLCDTYLNTNKRLYEQIIEFPEDESMSLRKELYNFIRTTFNGCLNIDTGGFTD